MESINKVSGFLQVDRPQRTSSQPPSLYGFIPRTFCGGRVADLCPEAPRADGDPLDICVLCEKVIPQGNILLQARPITTGAPDTDAERVRSLYERAYPRFELSAERGARLVRAAEEAVLRKKALEASRDRLKEGLLKVDPKALKR